jgi:hypothetical protein
MSDARDLRRRYVRIATATLSGALAWLITGYAQAAEGDGSASISLGGDSAASASTSAAPEGDTPPETPIDPRKKNPANYEFAFVSVAGYQTWSIAGSVLYFGAGGGIGPPLYRLAKYTGRTARSFGWDPNLEIAYANVFLRVAPVKYVDIDVGPKIGLGSALFDVPDAPQSTFSYGGYVDLRFGSPTIKVGPRLEFVRLAHSNFSETAWLITPLLLRVVH